MPVLYKPDENNFNHNGLGGLHGLLAYEVTEVLNGELELYMEYPVNGNLYEYIQDGVLIKAKPNRYDDPHVFRVYESELDITTQVIQIYAHSNTYDLQGNFVKDLAIRDMTPQQAMNMLKANAIEPVDFTFSSDIATRSSAYWENRSVLSCINGEEGSLLQIWGGEIKRGNKQLWLYARRGRDNVTTVRHSKNLSGLKATYSTKGLVTAILPYFNHRDEESDRETVIHGNIVYSDLVNKYPLTYYNAVEFNEEDGVTDLASLNAVASRYFENNEQDKPKVNIEIQLEELSQTKEYDKFKDFEQINIGDTFTTYSEKHKVEITAKAFKVVYDGLRDKTKEIEAGTTRATAYDAYRELFGRITDRSLRPIAKQLHIIQRTADGKNNIFRGVAEPPNEQSQEGDLWFKPVGEGMGEIYQFNGANWEIIIGQEVFDQIDMAIEDAKGQADQAVNDAEEAGQRAADALIKAGESDDIAKAAKDAADRAETNADDAQTKAIDALTKADDAIYKANNIPITIDNTIAAKGLVSGDWVDTRIDDATGEINHAITSVKGGVPNVVMGVEWSKISSPELSRTDYVEEFTSLADYQLKTAEYDLSIDGLTSNLQAIEVNKLDSSEFTSFKSNEYSQTVNGITNRLSSVEANKLEGNIFTSFKENDYQLTVDGLAGRLTTVETDKLEHADFTIFKENDYQLTVDGLKMGLTSVEGAIPTLVLGVSWSRTSNPAMERTDDAAAIDLSNYDSPDYIMGVEWQRDSEPEMERIRDTQEYTSTKDFEIFLGDYNFKAQGWNATNTYINDNKTSINSLISNAQGWSNTISYVDENKTAINETISQVTHYKQTIIGENGEKIAQLVMTDDAFVTRVSDLENMTADIILGVEWEKVSSPRMVRTGFMEDWASSQISQLADNINLKVSKGDLLSEINAQADGVLIRSGDNKLNITPETTYIQNSTIESAQIKSLNGSKITANTLNGNRIIANTLDVGAITGNVSDFVASYWNSAAGGGVSIGGNGILSIASNKSQTYIQNGIVGTRNPDGATIGQIGYINTGTIATYSLRTSWGSHFELRQRSNATTEYTMLRAENGATNFFINARDGIYLNTSNTGGRVNIDSEVRILNGNRLFLEDARIVNPYGIFLNHGGEFYTISGGSATRIGFGSELQFRQGATSSSTGTQKMMIDSTRNYMYQTLNMQGNSITESPSVSDGRLKNIFGDRVDNDLQKLLSIKYVNFMWKEDGNPDFGFIAQQIQGFAPEIVRDVNGGWLGYDQASYTHLIGHALQQHAGITANQLTQLRQENEALHDRITGLEARITELERAM